MCDATGALVEKPSQSCSREQLADLVRRGWRFAYSLTHDPTRADDLVQDAWLAVLRAGGAWTVDYLFAAVRSRFHDQLRREGLATFTPLAEHDDRLEDKPGPYDGGYDEESSRLVSKPVPGEADELWVDSETLDRALERLRPEERAVLYLAAVEERSARDIGNLLGWPRGTVLSLLHRCRGKLRAWLRGIPGART